MTQGPGATYLDATLCSLSSGCLCWYSNDVWNIAMSGEWRGRMGSNEKVCEVCWRSVM